MMNSVDEDEAAAADAANRIVIRNFAAAFVGDPVDLLFIWGRRREQ